MTPHETFEPEKENKYLRLHPNNGHMHHEHMHHGEQPHAPVTVPGPGHEGHDGGHGEHHAHMVADFRRSFWLSLALTIPIVILSPMVQHGLGYSLTFPGDRFVLFMLASIIYFYAGKLFLKGLAREVRGGVPAMMTLIGVAITVAYAYSVAVTVGLEGETLYWELATLITIMLFGHWIEMKSVMGASGAVKELVGLIPATAHRLKADGSAEDVPVAKLARGEFVLVKPGEKIPSDGVVVQGESWLNIAMLTGESRPVGVKPRVEVIGGAINGEGALTVEIKKTGKDTYLAQVVDMVQKAQASRSRAQDVADRAAVLLTFVALAGGMITLAIWLTAGRPLMFALERMVTVMVIACPHALGLAVPLVIAISTALAAHRGLFVRDRSAFERSRDIDVIIFDKTGTLTTGRFGVTDIVRIAEYSDADLLRMAATVEAASEHPIASGIIAAAKKRQILLSKPANFRAIPGKGAEATVDGKIIRVVSSAYLDEKKLGVPQWTASIAAKGKTVVYVLDDMRPVGLIGLADIVRPESSEAVAGLKQLGIRVMMLTGDSEPVAKSVANVLGIDEYFSQVLPKDKAARVREVKSRGLRVAMVGDGVNDAPALVEADLGIAIGAGTHIAMESADVVLVRSDPRDATAIVELSRATHRKMVQNLWWAAGYNIIAIPLAAGIMFWAGIFLPPAMGAVLMSASTVIVAINAQMLMKSRI